MSRRPPVKKGKRMNLCLRLLCCLAAIALCLALVAVYFMDNDHFDVSIYNVSAPELQNPIRIALLADLHQGSFGENNDVLLEQIALLEPDMICVVGDMINGAAPDWETVKALLSRLVEVAPVWYSMGNHEVQQMLKREDDVCGIIAESGATPLNNKLELVEINGNEIVIGGLTQSRRDIERYSNGFVEKFVQTEPDKFHILLSHCPENFDGYIEDEVRALALAGHAEGGLVRIPIIGALYTPDQGFFPKLTEGVHNIEDVTLVISRGLGGHGVVPRINNRPELVMIDIRP